MNWLIRLLFRATHKILIGVILFISNMKFIIYKMIYSQINFGKNIKVNGGMYLRLDGTGDFGDNLVFNNHTRFNFAGIKSPTSIQVNKGAYIKIGNNSGFSGTTIYCSKRIIIGSYCNFGVNTFIWDTDFHPLDMDARSRHDICEISREDIIIEDHVFVGANSIILKGVRIGEGSIIGAASVVTKDIMPFTINVGIPAHKIADISKK